MKQLRTLGFLLSLALAFFAGTFVPHDTRVPLESNIISQDEADRQEFEWGTLYTYYSGESYGTTDGLAATAIIKSGWQIHPPHEHPEEEFLMVLEGEGTWHLNGEESPAKAGDMQYAAPWDIHGIKNTGTTPLTFVVWKWNNKGVALPEKP